MMYVSEDGLVMGPYNTVYNVFIESKGKYRIEGDPLMDQVFEERFSDQNQSDYVKMFECDDLIAPTICILNRKGYRTTGSCQGHVSIVNKSIFDKENQDANKPMDKMYVDLPFIKFDWDSVKDERFLEYPEKFNVPGWNLEVDKESHTAILRGEMPDIIKGDFNAAYADLTTINMQLYNWACNLPNKNIDRKDV